MDIIDLINKQRNAGISHLLTPIVIETADNAIYTDCEVIIDKEDNQEICKLKLVNKDKVRPPVEDSIQLDGFTARFAKNNVLTHNLEHYPLIKNIINVIIKASNEGKICHTFIVPYVTKNDTFGVYYDEDEVCGVIRWHFKELGFNVKDKNDEVNNRNEFFISW